MAVAIKQMTSEELSLLEDDGFAYELYEGELVKMPPPGYEHGLIVVKAGKAIAIFVEEHSLGDVISNGGFTIQHDPDTVLAPDVAFVRTRNRRAEPRPEPGYPDFLPDLVLEVVSPSDHAAHMQKKVQKYLSAGIPMVVVLWPQTRMVTVHGSDGTATTLAASDRFDGGDIIPGFNIEITKMFP